MSQLASNDDDVGALLALIDTVYTCRRTTEALKARERRRYATAQRQDLLIQIEEVQNQLDATWQRFEANSAIYGTRLWGPVALRQRSQREVSDRQNESLKHMVRCQYALVQRVAAVMEELQSMICHALPRTRMPSQPGPCSPMPMHFVRRLDAVCERVASRTVEITSCNSRDHEIWWNDHQTVLRGRFRSRTRYPFQLSSVVDEFWRVLHEQTPTTTLAHDEVYHASAVFQLRKPFGRLEVRGPCAKRRVHSVDGDVVLISLAVVVGTESEANENIMTGLEMHETVMIRLLRTDASNPRSPVFVESMTEFEVFATPGNDEIHGYCLNRAHLKRFQDFNERYAAEERGEGQQKLENRLLDASLSRSRAASPV